MLEHLSTKLRAIVEKIKGKPYIDEKILNEIIRDIQRALLMSDINVNIVYELTNNIRNKIKEGGIPPGISLKEYLIKTLYDELVKILGEEKKELKIDKKPYVIMLIGLEGSGKTTSAAKLAKYFGEKGYKIGIYTTDVYRPAAREQLKQLVKSLSNVEYYNGDEKDSIKIALNGLKYFDKKVDIIIVDTAGRHKEERELLKEMKAMESILKPNIIFLVVDGTIGQKAYEQAKAFKEYTKIGGIIVTKLDGTARGGGALSAAAATGASIYFIGTGEKIDDIEYYDPHSFVGRLIGIGDIKGLIEKIKKIIYEKEQIERLKKIAKGRFTLVDMMEQIEQIYKMGGIYKILSYLPGFNINIPKEKLSEMEIKLKKWKAAINSMTLEEKINPKILKRTRLTRVSRGAGVDERTIREMVKQYEMMKKVMKSRKHKRLLKEYLSKYQY